MECKAISDGVQKLKDSATGPTYKLTDIVNTAEYAKTICQNTQYLDDKTQEYIRTSLGDSPDQVADILNSITVYTGVSRTVASQVANGLGLSFDPANVDAFTVGNIIFVFEDADFSNKENVYLIKHETIHSLQTVALGGVQQFLTEYDADVSANGYSGSKYELAAYSFGPSNSAVSNYNQTGSAKKGYIK